MKPYKLIIGNIVFLEKEHKAEVQTIDEFIYCETEEEATELGEHYILRGLDSYLVLPAYKGEVWYSDDVIGDFNGYAHFNYKAYKRKGLQPCFIAENSEEPQSWVELFEETLNTVRTKDFLLSVCENYEADSYIKSLENVDENTIDFKDVYLEVTGETDQDFAENFMDDYFLGGGEVWCSLSTKLEDYKY